MDIVDILSVSVCLHSGVKTKSKQTTSFLVRFLVQITIVLWKMCYGKTANSPESVIHAGVEYFVCPVCNN